MNLVFACPVGQEWSPRAGAVGRVSLSLVLVASSVVGGLTLGLGLYGLALLVDQTDPDIRGPIRALLYAVALRFALAELRRDRRLPQLRRQVPRQRQLLDGQVRVAMSYGYSLGTGVSTWVLHGAFHSMAIVAIAHGSWVPLVVGMTFGATRLSHVPYDAAANMLRPARLHVHGERLRRMERGLLSRYLGLSAGALCGVTAAIGLIGGL